MRKFYIDHTEIVFGCEMDRDAVIRAKSVKKAVAKLQQKLGKLGKKFGMITEMRDISSQDQDEHFYIEIAEFAVDTEAV